MWAPSDINAVLVSGDYTEVKREIARIKQLLLYSQTLKQQELCSVEQLEQQLLERKAWLAPVRRLPFELLSRIFEFSRDKHWPWTLRLGWVCHRWREVLFASPHVWTSLTFRRSDTSSVSKYLLRLSSQHPLQLTSWSTAATLALVKHNVASRLHHLTLSEMPNGIRKVTFPALTYLEVCFGPLSLWDITTDRFPVLRHLDCDTPRYPQATKLIPLESLPALETLKFAMNNPSESCRFLAHFNKSLRSLCIHLRPLYGFEPNPKPSISLPKLKRFVIIANTHHMWPLALKTPALEHYAQKQTGKQRLLHQDVTNVKQLLLQDTPEHLPDLHNLELLQLLQMNSIYVLAHLVYGSSCPNLKRVEVHDDFFFDETLSKSLNQIDDFTRMSRLLAFVSTFSLLPGLVAKCACTTEYFECPYVH